MENVEPQQQNTPVTSETPPSNFQSVENPSNRSNFLKIFFIALALILLGTLIGVLVSRFLFQSSTTAPIVTQTPSPIITETPTPTIDETASWKIYKVLGLGIELKLPGYLSPLDYPNGNETKGEKGKQFCVEYTKVDITSFLIKSVLAGGGACLPQYFGLGTTSVDYEAGRGGGFGDLQGYTYENGKYFAKMVLGKRFEIPAGLAKEITNPSGVKILRIIGENSQSSVEMPYLPIAGTPGDGRIGALINLDNVTYPGVSVEMKLSGNLNTELFDQILSTFKFTTQSQTPPATISSLFNSINKLFNSSIDPVQVNSFIENGREVTKTAWELDLNSVIDTKPDWAKVNDLFENQLKYKNTGGADGAEGGYTYYESDLIKCNFYLMVTNKSVVCIEK